MTEGKDIKEMDRIGELSQEAKDEAERVTRSTRLFLRYLYQQAWFPQHTPYNIFLLLKKRDGVRLLLSEEEIARRGLTVPQGRDWITFVVEQKVPEGTDGVKYRTVRYQDGETLDLPVPPATDLNRCPEDLTVRLIERCGLEIRLSEQLPDGEYGAWYDNRGNRVLIHDGMDDPELLFQRLTIQLALASFSRRVTPFSRRELAYPALCAAYLLCRRYGVSTEDLSVHRVAPALAGMQEGKRRDTLFLIHGAFRELDGFLTP